jgi:hypothetical protein
VIVGPDERAAGTVTLKALRVDGEQRSVGRGELVDHLRGVLSGAPDGPGGGGR